MMFVYCFAYPLVGMGVFSLLGEWPIPREAMRCTPARVQATRWVIKLLLIYVWPVSMLVFILEKIEGRHQLSWKVDVEGVELLVRDRAARDIEAFQDHVIKSSPEHIAREDAVRFVDSVYKPVIALVRCPEILPKIINSTDDQES